jgi:ribosome recycling factor
MTDDDARNWVRLGEYVVARRVHLGYKKRPAFSAASGISTRILGDIETGRRANFDRTTVAALENTLGWATGSVASILRGGGPTIVVNISDDVRISDSATAVVTPASEVEAEGDAALIKVMRSNLSDDQKKRLIRMLLADKEDAERQRVARADELIRLFDPDA